MANTFMEMSIKLSNDDINFIFKTLRILVYSFISKVQLG